jgi:glycosyltransferase involved in cell wall biosynthesis
VVGGGLVTDRADQRLLVVVEGGLDSAVSATVRAVEAQTVPPLLAVEIVRGGTKTAPLSDRVDFVAYLRAGSEPGAGWLDAAVDALRGDPTLGAAVCGVADTVVDSVVVTDGVVLRTDAWRRAGAWDPAVPGSIAGLDAGWRLWLTGHRVRAVPGMNLVERGPETTDRPPRDDEVDRVLVVLIDELPADVESALGQRTDRMSRRIELQSARRRPDGELLPMVAATCEQLGAAGRAVMAGIDRLGATERCGQRRRIVVATADTIAARMAGPAIRAAAIARALGRDHDVVLVTTGACSAQPPGVSAVAVDDAELARLVRWCDIFVFQGWVMAGRDFIADSPAIVVVDLYDPIHLEQLEQVKDLATERGRWRLVLGTISMLEDQLRRGDFFMCASEKQRALWLGQLGSARRLNPVSYAADRSLRALIDVVPFGVEPQAPVHTRAAMRGVMPAVGEDDLVIIWGGGVYEWFDPLTLVRAVDRLRQRHPTLRLVFMGMRHPNPDVPDMPIALELEKLAAELGLTPDHVVFNDWVAYDDRHNYLLEADIGVSTHHDHIETEFSFRTRILDYLWARLPIVATAGDSMADLIETEELGATARPDDVDSLVDALDRLLGDPALRSQCRDNIDRVAARFDWSACLEPLVEFCASARRSPDLACTGTEGTISHRAPGRRLLVGRDVARLRTYYRAGGPRLVLNRIGARVRRLLGRRT